MPEEEKWKHAVGLYPKGIRVDSKLLITNEFDESKCAEGFNVYLFADDFDSYFIDRAKHLLDRIEKATGKAISGRDSEETIREFGVALL